MNKFKKIIIEGKVSKLLNYFKNDDNCRFVIKNNLFWDNLIYLKNNFDAYSLEYIIKELIELEPNFIDVDNFNTLFKLNFNEMFYVNILLKMEEQNVDLTKFFNLNFNNKYTNKLLAYLVTYSLKNNDYDYILSNIDKIVNYSVNLISYIHLFKKNEILYRSIKEYIDSNSSIFIENLVRYSLNISKEKLLEEKILPYFKRIVEEVLNYENKKYSDIKLIGEGGSSVVYQIGDKVLKLGKSRTGFKIDNNKRFLKPLLRECITSLDQETLCYIEITEKVKTNEITEEDVYYIYKELRDEGLVWVDCYPSNLGRLNKKNKIYFNEDIKPFKEAINYLTDSFEELEKDDLIILDNELIFKEEEFNRLIGFDSENINSSDSIYIYEERYQKEKREKAINF